MLISWQYRDLNTRDKGEKMTESTCIKCSSHDFIIHPVSMEQHERHLLFVQCSQCGGVVGVVEDTNIKQEFGNIWAKLTEIESSIE